MASSSSLITGVLTSLLLFVVFVVIFTILSRKKALEWIYFPARKLAGLEPPVGRGGPLSWAFVAASKSDTDIASEAGLDATIYVLFLKTGLLIVLASLVVCLPVIVPLAVSDNDYEHQKALYWQKKAKYDDDMARYKADVAAGKNETKPKFNATLVEFSGFDKLSMGNIAPGSDRYWGCMICVYWVSFVCYFFLYRSYKLVSSLRARFLAEGAERPEQYVALVRDIPPAKNGQPEKDAVDAFFAKVHGDQYERCVIIKNVKDVNKTYQKLETSKKKLAHAEGAYRMVRESKKDVAPESYRPRHKTGFLGLVGEKVDSIAFYVESIREKLLPELEQKQRTLEAENSSKGAAFVIFKSRREAAMAAQTMHAKDGNAWVVSEAPEAREVVFENLALPWYQRLVRVVGVTAFVVALIFFFAIPLTAISGFTQLKNVEKLVPPLKKLPQAIKTILEAYLPTLAVTIFFALLPKLCLFLSKLEGLTALSAISRSGAGKLHSFQFCNGFLTLAIGGSLLSIAKQIAKRPASITGLLGASVAQSASTFVIIVAFGAFSGWGMELLRLVPLIMYLLKKRYLCKTEEEVKAAWHPGQCDYSSKVSAALFVIALTLVYCIIAPMILVFSMVYFGVGYLVSVNQALNVYVASDFESQGRMWPHIHNRVMFSVLFGQLTWLFYFGIKWKTYVLTLVPPVIFTIVFHYYCRMRFYKSFQHFPLETAAEEEKQVPTVASLVESFTPPCMLPQSEEVLEDPEQFEDARSALSSAINSDDDEVRKTSMRYQKVAL